MTTLVDTCWGVRPVEDQPYWHIVSVGGLFVHNVRVGKGALLSIAAAIDAEPNLENAHTPYSLHRGSDPKETVFEQVRQSKYPNCPSRLKTLYVFDDYSLAERALKEWFSEEQKAVLECRVLTGSVTHKADTQWLNCQPQSWQDNAEKYWQGVLSPNPFPEVLVHGALYFPTWQSL